MIDHPAIGVRCASSRTRIDTFLIDAGLIGWTVRPEETFRPAVGDRADHVRNAAALGLPRDDLALRIGSAWCWRARVWWYGS